MQFIRAWLKIAFTISLFACLWKYPTAAAGGIEDTARSLSEGDGINFQVIPRPFSSDAPHFIASSQQGINFPNTTLVSNLNHFAFNSSATRFTSDIAQHAPILEGWKPSIVFLYTQFDFIRFEANRPTDLSPTFTHQYINNDGLSLTGPFQFQLEAKTIGTDLYRDLEQDRFTFANHRLTGRWELGMIVPLRFGLWSRWPGAAGGIEQAGIGDILFSLTGPLRFQLKADAIRTDLFRPWSSWPGATGGMEQAGMGDILFSLIGPFRFWLASDTIRTDLYLDLGQDHFLFANHHLTRSWDIGMIVPLFFGPWSSWLGATGGMEKAGMGDIILQTQYKFPRKQLWWPDVMLRGQVKLPMGKAGFWGTEETDFKALLMISWSFGPLTPHVNLGVRWTTEGSQQNDLSYVAGLYAQVRPSLTLILDVLGRWEPYGDGIGDHTINLALGAKWYAHRGFLLSSYVLLPMNQPGGYRTDVTGTIRVEFLF